MNYSDKLALIREYRAQGGKGSYLSLLSEAQKLPDGGDLGKIGMMKARMAYASEFGNPTARRMTSMDGRSYTFTGDEGTDNTKGDKGNVYVSSYDNYVTPQIQDVNGKLQFIQQPWSDANWRRSEQQSIRFDSPEDAQYFGEHYKEIAPMMHQYPDGGKITTQYTPYRDFTAEASSTDTGGYQQTVKTKEDALSNRVAINNAKQYRNVGVIKSDDRDERQKQISKEYTRRVTNPTPSEQLLEGAQNILRYTANPAKLLGDIGQTIGGKNFLSNEFPNTKQDVLNHRIWSNNPFLSDSEYSSRLVEEVNPLAVESLSNIGLAEFGYLSPSLSRIPAAARIFKEGSRANLTANALQLGKQVMDSYNSNGESMSNAEDWGNLALNTLGVVVKGADNLNTGDMFQKFTKGQLRNTLRGMSRDEKLNLLQDAASHGENVTSQYLRTQGLGGYLGNKVINNNKND